MGYNTRSQLGRLWCEALASATQMNPAQGRLYCRFGMDADFLKNHAFRWPQWRAERVIYLTDNPKVQPRRSDDHYVRAYRRYRILETAAGSDETKLFAAFLQQPHSYVAHAIYYGPDRELRHILEARLLTGESLAEIANRFKMEKETVAHYEALFFNVRNRLHNADWIHGVILGQHQFLVARMDGVLTQDQRGFLYRLFGYYGGPDVLDAVIHSIGSTTMPQGREDVAGWLDHAVDQIVQSWVAANRIRDLDTVTVVHLLDLVVGPQRKAKTSRAARKWPQTDFEVFVSRIAAKLTGRASPRDQNTTTAPRKQLASVVRDASEPNT